MDSNGVSRDAGNRAPNADLLGRDWIHPNLNGANRPALYISTHSNVIAFD